MYAEAVNGVEPFHDPLGEVAELVADGRAADAIARCGALIEAGRGGVLTRVALGQCLTALQRPDDAIRVLQETRLLAPDRTDVLIALGAALRLKGDVPEALDVLQQAVRLAPDDGDIRLAIGGLWLDAGEPDRADAAIEIALSLGAIDASGAVAWRERTTQMRKAPRAAAGYVRQLFNQFASDYDTRMRQRLGYAAPSLLFELAALLIDPQMKHGVLDLGCGTGLSGVAFGPVAKGITGIDLSARMLEKAQMTGAYEMLVEGDIEDLPAECDGPFDLIVAADVLVYLGDLSKVFAGVRGRLKKGGLWLFTTEQGDAAAFELGEKRRFRHSETYLRGLAEIHGFEVASLIECVCRHEAGQGVASWAAAFRAG